MLYSKGEAHPGSSSFLFLSSQPREERAYAVRTKQHPFLGERIFLPLCFRFSLHHTLMLLAKKKKIKHSEVAFNRATGSLWGLVPDITGSVEYQPLACSPLVPSSTPESLSFRVGAGWIGTGFRATALVGSNVCEVRPLGDPGSITCSFRELGIELREW